MALSGEHPAMVVFLLDGRLGDHKLRRLNRLLVSCSVVIVGIFKELAVKYALARLADACLCLSPLMRSFGGVSGNGVRCLGGDILL